MRDHAARWQELHPCPFRSLTALSLRLTFIPPERVSFLGHFVYGGLSVNGRLLDGDNTACRAGCHSFNVLSVCLCSVLNINRAEKCPEWNEFVAAWSLRFLMMVISRMEGGNILLCTAAEKQMTVFGTTSFSAAVSVCAPAINGLTYEEDEMKLKSSWKYFLPSICFTCHRTNLTQSRFIPNK